MLEVYFTISATFIGLLFRGASIIIGIIFLSMLEDSIKEDKLILTIVLFGMSVSFIYYGIECFIN